MTTPEENATEDHAGNGESSAHSFIEALRRGESWFPCLLHTIGEWTIPAETWQGRRYPYLIGNEAFDWLLLAERLLEDAGDLIPAEERAKLLFDGEPPMPMDDNLFREMIGHQKHSAHLNFLYGVVVEEALQQAVLEEVAKAGQSMGTSEGSLEEEAFRHLYNAPLSELHDEFRRMTDDHQNDSMSLEGRKTFTYWLFKRRVARSEPARLASDTRKALRVFDRLQSSSWHWTQGEGDSSSDV